MANRAESIKRTAEESWNVGETVTDTVGQIKDKVTDLGRTATSKIDQQRDAAASGLQEVASAIDENADSLPGGRKVASLARTTADKLSSTADYVREHNVNDMMQDVEALVKKNPGASLVTAAIFGFLLGRAFSSRD